LARTTAALGAAALLTMAAPGGAQAEEDPDYLSLGVGLFDWNRQKDEAIEFRVEYRSDYKLWVFKPFVVASATTDKMTFFGGGVLMDIYFGPRWVLTPSFAPTWWRGKTANLDLGAHVEFRSQLELAYRFDDRSRLGVAIAHYSNASISDQNPGTETAFVYYSIPFRSLFGN